jgi:hypothetical protein
MKPSSMRAFIIAPCVDLYFIIRKTLFRVEHLISDGVLPEIQSFVIVTHG